jgi:hypothetical protein
MTDATDHVDRRLFVVASESLEDVGLDGYVVAEGIDPSGDRVLLLACERMLGDERYPFAPATEVEHEQLGQLDWRLRGRVQLAPLRCGRRTQRGTPCRNFVTYPGQPCGWHRTTNQRKEQS